MKLLGRALTEHLLNLFMAPVTHPETDESPAAEMAIYYRCPPSVTIGTGTSFQCLHIILDDKANEVPDYASHLD